MPVNADMQVCDVLFDKSMLCRVRWWGDRGDVGRTPVWSGVTIPQAVAALDQGD